MKETAAGVFKANCLAVMDEVQAKRETVVITKHDKPVAKLVPVNTDLRRDLPLPRWQGCGYRRLRLACPYTGRMGRTLLILVDTHVVVWLAFGQSQISSQARAAI